MGNKVYTTEEIKNIVEDYIKSHQLDKCYGLYITKYNEEYYVGDALSPMNGNRFTPIKEYFNSIKNHLEKGTAQQFTYKPTITLDTIIINTPLINNEISFDNANKYIIWLTEQNEEYRANIADKLRKIAKEIESGLYHLNGSIICNTSRTDYNDTFYPFIDINWKLVNENLDKFN